MNRLTGRTGLFAVRRAAMVLAALACVAAPARAQDGTWTAYTSMQEVREVDAGPARVWAATSGGVFGYDVVTGEIERYTVVEGLHSVDTRTLAVDDARAVVWVGYADGVLDRLDPASGAVVRYRDIERARQFASRGINRILVEGDSLLIATEFGVVVFDAVRGEVRDAYTRFGSFAAAIPAYDVLRTTLDGMAGLWVATAEGVAHAPLDAPNLQDPSAWDNETAGFPSGGRTVRALAVHRDRLYVGTEQDLWERTPTGYVRLFVSSNGVRKLVAADGRLYGTERFRLAIVDGEGSWSWPPIPGYENPQGLAVGPQGALWLGDALGGLLEVSWAPGQQEVAVDRVVIPDGPAETQFTDLDQAADGTLWVGGFTGSTSGFHRRTPDGVWTAYTGVTRAELDGRSRYIMVHAAADGSGWAGSEGDGLARVLPDGTVEVYDQANSSLQPAAGTSDFVIVGGLDSDADGNLWVTTRGAGNPLHVRRPDGSWTPLPPYVGDGLTSRATAYGRILVDGYDQKWIVLHDENNFRRIKGLLVADTGQDPGSPSDDAFRVFLEKGAAGQGLPGVEVTSVVEDREGLVWIGTDSGIAFVVNTGDVARSTASRPIWPPWSDRSQGSFVLFGLHVNDLAVDPANRLWVATREGAWLIEAAEAGYALVAHFTAENSPLFSDEVLSVLVDDRTGEVFFATDQGMVSYAGDAIAPAPSARDLFVYPNPFRPSEGSGMVTIEGLVEQTDVRIVTPGGIVVASIAARGGRVRWDGRDRDGHPVPSGMYLVVAVAEGGEGTAYGRLAVIR